MNIDFPALVMCLHGNDECVYEFRVMSWRNEGGERKGMTNLAGDDWNECSWWSRRCLTAFCQWNWWISGLHHLSSTRLTTITTIVGDKGISWIMSNSLYRVSLFPRIRYCRPFISRLSRMRIIFMVMNIFPLLCTYCVLVTTFCSLPRLVDEGAVVMCYMSMLRL